MLVNLNSILLIEYSIATELSVKTLHDRLTVLDRYHKHPLRCYHRLSPLQQKWVPLHKEYSRYKNSDTKIIEKVRVTFFTRGLENLMFTKKVLLALSAIIVAIARPTNAFGFWGYSPLGCWNCRGSRSRNISLYHSLVTFLIII